MKPIRAAVVLLALTALGAPSASAAMLDKGTAARSARVALSEYADHRCNLMALCERAAYPKLTKYDCKRLSARAVRCEGLVDLVFTEEDEFGMTEFAYQATVLVRQGRNERISGWRCLLFFDGACR